MSNALDNITDSDLDWLAGLLEGEGSFASYIRTNKQGNSWHQCSIQMATVDLDVAERVAEIIGGKVYGPYSYRTGAQPYYQAQLNRRLEVQFLAIRIKPLMGVRRRAQLDKLLEDLNARI